MEPDAMIEAAERFRTANVNTAPPCNWVRIDCGPTFPAIGADRPVFIVHDPRFSIELHGLNGVIRPRILAFRSLSPVMLLSLGSSTIVSYIVAPSYDAFELAARLKTCGYRGRYFAIGPMIPDMSLIRHEIRTSARGIDFDVFPITNTSDVDNRRSTGAR